MTTGHVSNIHDPRRSNGEKELIERLEKSLLLPQDEAFHPAAKGVEVEMCSVDRVKVIG